MKTKIVVLTIVVSVILLEIYNSTKPKHPYAGLNIEQLVHKYGYPIESHKVVTEDGYILTLHRIPYGLNEPTGKRVPVLFMHGFTQSAKDFVNIGPSRALSFLLAEKGYDVWLGNARGTTWSKKHKWLDPDRDLKFWDFSLHEIGYYDLPAFMDYILEETQQDSLHYVGYSQGTTIFFILGAEKPTYMQKVKLMTALAPSIFLKEPGGLLTNTGIHFRKTAEFLIDLFRFRDFLGENSFASFYLKHICNKNSLFVSMCHQFISNLHGHSNEANETELSLIFSTTPAGASGKQMMHIVQLMASGEFHKYDLGTRDNLRKYGQVQPPHYDVSKIQTPVALYYSSNDKAVNVKNMKRILQTLPNVVKSYHVPLSTFNHNDFINARNVVDLLYNDVIEEILKY